MAKDEAYLAHIGMVLDYTNAMAKCLCSSVKAWPDSSVTGMFSYIAIIPSA